MSLSNDYLEKFIELFHVENYIQRSTRECTSSKFLS
jgi:hypothetical protein